MQDASRIEASLGLLNARGAAAVRIRHRSVRRVPDSFVEWPRSSEAEDSYRGVLVRKVSEESRRRMELVGGDRTLRLCCTCPRW